jgi:hypothetical protein
MKNDRYFVPIQHKSRALLIKFSEKNSEVGPSERTLELMVCQKPDYKEPPHLDQERSVERLTLQEPQTIMCGLENSKNYESITIR